jgi:outer membrane protein assembly factor BamE (lipoprotein component of BamABCDE complex)
MKKIFISTSIIILFLCLGCIYIPYPRNIIIHRAPDKKTLESIKEGVTSKEDILMMLGEPDRVRNNERLFLYWWQEECGVLGNQYVSIPIRHTYSLHIEFDENNIVKKFEIIKDSMSNKFDEKYEKISE